MKIFYGLVCFLLVITFLGCGATYTERHTKQVPQGIPPQGQTVPEKEYRFQVGDVFDVKFFETPDLDQTITVRPDGRISIPLVENLLVVGMTPSELDSIITETYKAKIKEPEVTIILTQFVGQKVYVGGEVLNQGVLQLTGRMTLLQSLFNAGGFKRSAKLNNVVLIRNNDNKPEIHMIDVDKIMNQGEYDVLLRPYDVVFVPKTAITKAGDFVDQYINDLMPDMVRFGLNFIYPLGTQKTERTVVVE